MLIPFLNLLRIPVRTSLSSQNMFQIIPILELTTSHKPPQQLSGHSSTSSYQISLKSLHYFILQPFLQIELITLSKSYRQKNAWPLRLPPLALLLHHPSHHCLRSIELWENLLWKTPNGSTLAKIIPLTKLFLFLSSTLKPFSFKTFFYILHFFITSSTLIHYRKIVYIKQLH